MKPAKAEREAAVCVKRYLWIIIFAAAGVLGVVMRLSGAGHISRDIRVFLLPWYREMKSLGGLKALATQVGDYTVPYQVCIALMTYLPADPVTLIKLLSCAFDFLLAAGIAALTFSACDGKRKEKAALSFLVSLCLPTVVLNSSVWGQCDSIYAALAVWSLCFLQKEKPFAAFWMYGLSLSFKLQAIFLLPVFVIYYFKEKKFTALHFLQIPATFLITSLPAIFAGRSLPDILSVYGEQTDMYRYMYMNYPSLYTVIGDDYENLKTFAVALCFAVLATGFALTLRSRKTICGARLIEISVLCVWCCAVFLPAMHERYAYVADVLSVALAFCDTRFIPAAATVNLTSLAVYGSYLYGTESLPLPALGVLNTAALMIFAAAVLRGKPDNRQRFGVEKQI